MRVFWPACGSRRDVGSPAGRRRGGAGARAAELAAAQSHVLRATVAGDLGSEL